MTPRASGSFSAFALGAKSCDTFRNLAVIAMGHKKLLHACLG
jgi:hypothetical protein